MKTAKVRTAKEFLSAIKTADRITVARGRYVFKNKVVIKRHVEIVADGATFTMESKKKMPLFAVEVGFHIEGVRFENMGCALQIEKYVEGLNVVHCKFSNIGGYGSAAAIYTTKKIKKLHDFTIGGCTFEVCQAGINIWAPNLRNVSVHDNVMTVMGGTGIQVGANSGKHNQRIIHVSGNIIDGVQLKTEGAGVTVLGNDAVVENNNVSNVTIVKGKKGNTYGFYHKGIGGVLFNNRAYHIRVPGGMGKKAKYRGYAHKLKGKHWFEGSDPEPGKDAVITGRCFFRSCVADSCDVGYGTQAMTSVMQGVAIRCGMAAVTWEKRSSKNVNLVMAIKGVGKYPSSLKHNDPYEMVYKPDQKS